MSQGSVATHFKLWCLLSW